MHLSGVATAAARAVQAIEGTGAKILDTRKTTPGMRALEKAAVAAGGATNHRAGLYDAILIKENHIAAAGGIAAAIERCRAGSDLPLEIEVRNDARDRRGAGGRRQSPAARQHDRRRAARGGRAGRRPREARSLRRLHAWTTSASAAETGVDFISMGSITHGAPALDLSMIIEHADRRSAPL